MTREDIIRKARESADQSPREDWNTNAWVFGEEALERFFHAAYGAGAAAEREACAQVCENMSLEWQNQPNIAQAELATIMDCALAIRTRGEKRWVKSYAGGKPNYTTPEEQTRQWQGLTEAEKVNVAIDCGCADVAWIDFADAIEAKLKEKNT